MAKYVVDGETLTGIADKLRQMKNSDNTILLSSFASEIEKIYESFKNLIDGSIVDLIIPNGTKSVRAYMFSGSTGLKSVVIPESVTSIGNTAFSWCLGMKSIKIPKSVSSIGSYAFTNCENCLTYDFSDHTQVPTLSDSTVFNGINSKARIIVPEALYVDWVNAAHWSAYSNNIVSVGRAEAFNTVPLEAIWIYGSGCFGYVTGRDIALYAYYQIDDGAPTEFSNAAPAFESLGMSQSYDGDTCYTMNKTSYNGKITLGVPGEYKFWIQDSSGNKYYQRILEVV